MSIRKADLKEFVQGKAKKRKDELREKARVVISRIIKPVIYQAYKSIEPIERQAQRLHDDLITLQEQHSRFRDWQFNSIIRDVNTHLIGLRDDIVSRQTNLALYNLLDSCTNGLMEGISPLIDGVKVDLRQIIRTYKELVKVTDEIVTVIDASHNGDKAYKQLQELGVDLTGFNVSSSNLPAVVKLSADVCVFNGDC